jgi:hypothetical protein
MEQDLPTDEVACLNLLIFNKRKKIIFQNTQEEEDHY